MLSDDERLLMTFLAARGESGWIELSKSALVKITDSLSRAGFIEAKFRLTDAGRKALEDN